MTLVPDPQWSHIAVTRRDGVTHLRFHSHEDALVWSSQVEQDAIAAFTWVHADEATKVVLLSGTGDRWCTQLDSSGFAELAWEEIWLRGRRLLTAMQEVPVPVVAAVRGPATIHSEIPLMADLVLVSDDAEFADHAHFVRDVVPGDGVNLVWRDLLGRARANFLLLTGEPIRALEAYRIGAVSGVLPSTELLDRAWALALQIAQRPRKTLLYTKAAITIGRLDLAQGLSHGLAVQGSAHGPRPPASLEGSRPPSRWDHQKQLHHHSVSPIYGEDDHDERRRR
jgi:enoyl-CoA hydratase/carnithine racemase